MSGQAEILAGLQAAYELLAFLPNSEQAKKLVQSFEKLAALVVQQEPAEELS
jgi:hypothetical protein